MGGVMVLTNAKGGGWLHRANHGGIWNPTKGGWMSKWIRGVVVEVVEKKTFGGGGSRYSHLPRHMEQSAVSAAHADDNRTQKALHLVLLTASTSHERDELSARYVYYGQTLLGWKI